MKKKKKKRKADDPENFTFFFFFSFEHLDLSPESFSEDAQERCLISNGTSVLDSQWKSCFDPFCGWNIKF